MDAVMICLVGGIFLISLGAWIGYNDGVIVGERCAETRMRRAATIAGVGYWTVDDDGDTEWHWGKPGDTATAERSE